MPIANPSQLLHEDGRRGNISAFALNGLNKNGSDFLRRKSGLEQFVFDKASAGQRVLLTLAIDVRIENVSYARRGRTEAAALLRLRCGKRQSPHGPSVKC